MICPFWCSYYVQYCENFLQKCLSFHQKAIDSFLSCFVIDSEVFFTKDRDSQTSPPVYAEASSTMYLFYISPVAYLFDTSDGKNQCIGLHQPGDPGWLMYHYAG